MGCVCLAASLLHLFPVRLLISQQRQCQLHALFFSAALPGMALARPHVRHVCSVHLKARSHTQRCRGMMCCDGLSHSIRLVLSQVAPYGQQGLGGYSQQTGQQGPPTYFSPPQQTPQGPAQSPYLQPRPPPQQVRANAGWSPVIFLTRRRPNSSFVVPSQAVNASAAC